MGEWKENGTKNTSYRKVWNEGRFDLYLGSTRLICEKRKKTSIFFVAVVVYISIAAINISTINWKSSIETASQYIMNCSSCIVLKFVLYFLALGKVNTKPSGNDLPNKNSKQLTPTTMCSYEVERNIRWVSFKDLSIGDDLEDVEYVAYSRSWLNRCSWWRALKNIYSDSYG